MHAMAEYSVRGQKSFAGRSPCSPEFPLVLSRELGSATLSVAEVLGQRLRVSITSNKGKNLQGCGRG